MNNLINGERKNTPDFSPSFAEFTEAFKKIIGIKIFFEVESNDRKFTWSRFVIFMSDLQKETILGKNNGALMALFNPCHKNSINY